MTAYSDRAHFGSRVAAARLNYDPTRPVDDRARDAARRHSLRVRWLKIVLPSLALLAAVVFWGAVRFVPSDFGAIARGAGIDAGSDQVVMDKPRISGFEGTRRAYVVEAASAVQSLTDPRVVTFSKIDARIGLDGAGTATLGAATGVYDARQNTLALRDGIAIATDTGYSADVDAAAIDLGKGSFTSSGPMEIRMAQGTIRAHTVSVSERGRRVVFTDGVSVTFTPAGELLPGGSP